MPIMKDILKKKILRRKMKKTRSQKEKEKKEGNNNKSPGSFKKEGKSNLFGSQNEISYLNEGLKIPKKEGEIKSKEDKQDQIILNEIKTKMIIWYEKMKKEKEQFGAEKAILSKQKEYFQAEIQEEKENLAKQEELIQAKINKF